MGLIQVRQRGSHIQLRGVVHGRSLAVTVPAGRRQVDAGTLASILRQAGIERLEFERLVDE
jgi:predicted RNA binding protein YcfA (HicA-like mRNA interferase family)